MPRWTQEQLNDYERKRAANAMGLRASLPEPPLRPALDHPTARETTRLASPAQRYRILYTIYSLRPMDYDNIAIKKLQDGLVRAGFLPDDNWQVLEGAVRSCKASTQAEERTEIEIVEL